MVFQKILLVPIPFVQRKKPISKRANQTPNDSVLNIRDVFSQSKPGRTNEKASELSV